MSSNTHITIIDARVVYFLDDAGRKYSNSPDVSVLLSDDPYPHFRYKNKSDEHGTVYYAEHEGFVSVWYDRPHNRNGMGGRKFPIILEDGSTFTLHGPWCGNPTQFYTHTTKEFGVLVDTHHSYDPNEWAKKKMGNFFGLWATLARVKEACQLVRPVDGDEKMFSLVPVVIDKAVGPRINYAIVKQASSAYEWGGDSDFILRVERAS